MFKFDFVPKEIILEYLRIIEYILENLIEGIVLCMAWRKHLVI